VLEAVACLLGGQLARSRKLGEGGLGIGTFFGDHNRGIVGQADFGHPAAGPSTVFGQHLLVVLPLSRAEVEADVAQIRLAGHAAQAMPDTARSNQDGRPTRRGDFEAR